MASYLLAARALSCVKLGNEPMTSNRHSSRRAYASPTSFESITQMRGRAEPACLVRGAPRDEHDDFALAWRKREGIRRPEPPAILDQRREQAARVGVLPAHRAKDRAANGLAWKVGIHVSECTHRDRVRCVALVRIRCQDDGRHAFSELADKWPIRLVIGGNDREADVSVLDLRGRRDAPERNPEVERSQKAEDRARTIDDKHARRRRGSPTVHTVYSPSTLMGQMAQSTARQSSSRAAS